MVLGASDAMSKDLMGSVPQKPEGVASVNIHLTKDNYDFIKKESYKHNRRVSDEVNDIIRLYRMMVGK